MEPQQSRGEKKPANRSPELTANRLLWTYLLIGFAWILISDYAIHILTGKNLAEHDFLNTFKGLTFVLITGLVMFKWLLQRELIRKDSAHEELRFIKQLNELSHDPMYVLDPADDFRLIHVNEATVRHFGQSREKLLTTRIRDWLPDYALSRLAGYWKQLREGKFAVFESEHRLSSGRVVPVEISANYIVYQGKEYVGGYFRDISERKKTEAELQESKERYELALRGAELGTWDWNVSAGTVIFNRRWAEMLGYRLEELRPEVKTWEKLVHPDDLPDVLKKLEQHLQGYTSFYSAEYRLKTKTGEWLWILDSGSVLERDVEGKAVRAVGIHLDIDDRKRAENLVHEQRVMLESILNSIPQAVFWKDRSGRYLGCNRVFAVAAGMNTPEEIIGKNDLEMPWGEKEGQAYIADDREVMESRTPKPNIIEPITMADGSYRWLETSKTPLLSPTGEVFGVLGVFEDITDRRQLEQQLLQERDFSKWTMTVLPGVFYVLEQDGCVRMWNPQLERVTGRTAEQIKGLNCLKLLHPEDHAKTRIAIQGVLENGEDQVDARLVALDGTTHPHHFRGRRIELDGRPCILGVGMDISGRLEMEAELQRQLEFQRTLMDSIPLPLAVKNTAGEYLLCNRAFEEFTGVTQNQLPGLKVTDIMPEDIAREHQAKDAKLLENPGMETFECKLRHQSGEMRDVIMQKNVFRQSDGTVGGILGVAMDVTNRKRDEIQLRLQESALRAAANGIVITDRNGQILWANPAFTTLTGYTVKEIAGLTPQVLKSGRQSKEFYDEMWTTILSGRVWRGAMVNKRKDGSFYDEEMTITPLLDEAKEITHFIAIKQDVTQRKQMEAQYLRAQRMEGIGLLAGGIAHDLNNVLAPILMSVQLLEEMHPDDDTREILRNLQSSTQRGADIVRQVLTFARGIKGERLLLTPKHLIKDMVRVAKEAFPKNIRISSNVPADLWNIMGDPTQLHQVLLNLTINARDAMPDGGTLNVDARNETVKDLPPEHGIQIADGDYVVMAVMDTGMGIPPELHERILEPFFTTKELGKGTGLGLSTVVGIVKSHHGYLRIISEPGKGAEFMVYLPGVKDGNAADIAEAETKPPMGHGELILLVDDEPPILEVGKDILLRQGYRVVTANDGTEALALVAQQQGKVHVVITDIMMPFMDGVALVRSLRKMAPEIKIIASSGLASGASMTDKVDELKRMGIPSIMHKPFSAQKLLLNVHHILHGEPMEPEPETGGGSQ